MYNCEMIRQSNEIFCFTIRNRAITAHAFSHVNSSRSRQKIKTVPANFKLLCEGQKGQNTWQKGHNTGQKGHFRDKRDKTRSFKTKGQKGHLFGSLIFPESAWSPRGTRARGIYLPVAYFSNIKFFPWISCISRASCFRFRSMKHRFYELSTFS